MDVLSQSEKQHDYNGDSFSSCKIITDKSEDISDDKKNDTEIFRLNPLLNDSLNNLVKRFERTKIPKPPPTKGLSIRKKSKLSNSLPNLFLPIGFDDNKYCSNEKKVSWTNKLDLNLERLKSAFRDTYSYWCQQKRSQSIPNLIRNYNEESNKKEVFVTSISVSKNEGTTQILSRENTWNVLNYNQSENYRKSVDLVGIETIDKNSDLCDLKDKPSYSTHVYLDGAIIEPISPASLTCSTEILTAVNDNKITDLVQNMKPQGKKKGRPKKMHNIVRDPIVPEDRDLNNDLIDININKKLEESSLAKKQKKFPKQNKSTLLSQNVEVQNLNISNTNACNQNYISGTVNKEIEKSTGLRKQKKIHKENKLIVMNNEDINHKVVDEQNVSLTNDEVTDKSLTTRKQNKLLKHTKQISGKDSDVQTDNIHIHTNKGYDIEDICGMKTNMTDKTENVSISKKHTPLDLEIKSTCSNVQSFELSIDTSSSERNAKSSEVKINENLENSSSLNKTKNLQKQIKSLLENNTDSEIYIQPFEKLPLSKKTKTKQIKSTAENTGSEMQNQPVEKVSPLKKPKSVPKYINLTPENDQNSEIYIELPEKSPISKNQINLSKELKHISENNTNSEILIEQPLINHISKDVYEESIETIMLKNFEGHSNRQNLSKQNKPASIKDNDGNKHTDVDVKSKSNKEKSNRKQTKVSKKSKATKSKQDDSIKLESNKCIVPVNYIEPTQSTDLEIINLNTDSSISENKLSQNLSKKIEIIVESPNTEITKDTESDFIGESINTVIFECQKKTSNMKASPINTKEVLTVSHNSESDLTRDKDKETDDKNELDVSQKESNTLKEICKDESQKVETMPVLLDESIKDLDSKKSLVMNVENLLESTHDENLGKFDLLKEDNQEMIEQSNDIEVLSKSLADSVDTSMLPPRKRYKRLMYLDHSKSTSPKDTCASEITINENYEGQSENTDFQGENELQTEKVTNYRSRVKRKKQSKQSTNVKIDSTKDTCDYDTCTLVEVKDELITNKDVNLFEITTEKNILADKPSSLKRSKREAAARGFANMVAMSINNNSNSQSHETPDITKKSLSSKVDTSVEVLTDNYSGKIFKRPRKTTSVNSSASKSKEKLSKTYDFADDIDNDEEVETVKVATKKQRIVKDKCNNAPIKENPPSPDDTVISNSSSQDTLKYRKIRTNTYVDPKPAYWSQEVEKCGCKRSDQKHLYGDREKSKSVVSGLKKTLKWSSNLIWDCSDNCLNRLTYTECNPKTCPCGDLCNNQKIRKLEWATGIKVTDIQSKGRGVIATKPIKEGTLITEYVGEVISEATFQERMINLYREDAHHYCLHLDGEMLIDAYRSGSLARFVNHSCQPNCEMQKWMVNGAYRMCLFASEDIGPDTELTYDYNFCSFNTKTTQICLCGASNCRGFIGGRPRAEQSESQKDKKKLFYVFGRTLSIRERLFVIRRAIFLIRGRVLGRCRRLGIRSKQTHGNKLPSAITEIKRRKAKKNQFLTQMSALNSIRSIRTRLLQNAQNNENLTRTAQLAQVLRDLYNTLLEQKDPLSPTQQLVAPFVNSLKQKKYPEFYNTVGQDSIVSLSQVYSRLLDGKYTTMMSFDQDILQMMQNIELYAGKQSNIGKCAERMKPVYKDLKMNAIALFEALTDEMIDDKDKSKLLSNNLTQITNAVKSLSNNAEIDLNDSISQPKSKKRKQGSTTNVATNRGRLERGAEVIKCICGFLIEAGHVMVQCDRCFVWQHAYCMNVARSSELVDVTRMEPYFCHICLNIPTESLIREIPRHFVITDETVDGGNTLFWTLLHQDSTLLKIDDFVYIPSEDSSISKNKIKTGSPQSIDLSQLTIMRIYSLWKDSNGQRWMEGGLFQRPYNSYLKSVSDSKLNSANESCNKRKSNLVMDLNSHKWHHQEVVYTDLTKILPLDVCVGRCHVLNNHTFRLGKPLSQNNSINHVEHVYVCDLLINKTGEWSEIDPSYLKINMKPYCFDRHIECDSNNDKFIRQYTTQELLKLDQGFMEDSCTNKYNKNKSTMTQDEKRMLRMQSFEKLVVKLSEFAYERTRKLPLSPPSSVGSRSTPSSRGASPLCESAGSKSPLLQGEEYYPHCSRKQLFPKKTLTDAQAPHSLTAQVASKTPNTVTSEYSENSPKLMIVCEDDRAVKEQPQKIQEAPSSNDDKNSDVVSSSLIENLDDRSNPCSEIKYGDLLNLLKETVPVQLPKMTKASATKKQMKKGKRKSIIKKNVIKPVSEINKADDNWVPTSGRIQSSSSRRETRSRRSVNEDKTCDNKSKTEIDYSEQSNDLEEEEDEGRKTCFVKLERIKVSRAEKNKQKKSEKEKNSINESDINIVENIETPSLDGSSQNNTLNVIIDNKTDFVDNLVQQAESSSSNNDKLDNVVLCQVSSNLANSRSKRKKGVPKRIPFDFAYQQSQNNCAKVIEGSTEVLPFEFDVVDLSAGKPNQGDQPDQLILEVQKTESSETSTPITLISKSSKVTAVATSEARHITAANDFSSIENISSN